MMNYPVETSPKWFHSITKLMLCLLASLAISLTLFLFMHKLVNQPTPKLPNVAISGFVELFRVTPDMQVEEAIPEPEQARSEPEPQTQALNLLSQTDNEVSLPDNFESYNVNTMPSFTSGIAATNIEVAEGLLEDFGQDTQQGFTEIIPFATRRPNIPQLAYENQLNGWVLVIYEVSATGKPHNIKILDANPKGIFEEEVIRAIALWRYDVRDVIGIGQSVIMTQKIELNWQDYPQNLPYER